MKIAINTKNLDLINSIKKLCRSKKWIESNTNVEIIHSVSDEKLAESIVDPTIDGFILGLPSSYSQKSIDRIKRFNPNTPILVFGSIQNISSISGADIFIPISPRTPEEAEYSEDLAEVLFSVFVKNIKTYLDNFKSLKRLTSKISDAVEFDKFRYDPMRRSLSYNGKEIKKLSGKEGGIIEVLGSNFGKAVKKEVILEKVWHKSDYFSGRSMDVYVTHLRKLFSETGASLTIKNISGVGLIME